MASLIDADRARYLLAWIPPTHHDALGLPLRLSSLLITDWGEPGGHAALEEQGLVLCRLLGADFHNDWDV